MRSSLFVRTAVLLLALSIMPTLLVGFIQMRIVESTLGRDFQEVKVRLAERTANSVSDFLVNVTSLLTTIGQVEEISKLEPRSIRLVVKQLLQSQPVIAEISVYDRKGNWVFGMERTPGSLDPSQRLDHLSDYVKEIVSRQGTLRGNILTVANFPAVEIFVPVRDANRTVVGFMRSVISLASLSQSLAETSLGKTSEFFVTDIKNRLIAHSGNRKIFRPETADPKVDPAIYEEIRKMGPYDSWSGRLKLSDGREVVVALKKMEDLPWIAGILQENWEAFVIMIAMRQKIAEVLLGGSVLVMIIALFVAGRISSPVRLLTRAARQLMAGNFSQPVEHLPKSNDEIGELSAVFETMSKVLSHRTRELVGAQDELKRFNHELEDRVEARTKELKAMQDELIRQERLAAIGQMASVVGHELRNPLSVINNSIYVIKTRLQTDMAAPAASENPTAQAAPGPDPKILKHVNTIEAELHVANQIISEILTFARTREIQLREVELHALLEDIISKFEPPAGVVIVKDYANQSLHMKLDTDEVRQALRNLIGNAIDAMPNGGQITVGTKLSQKSVLLTVSDTGGGIKPEILPKIFTPFFTSKPKGTGLGLAVVKKVLDRHNAEVVVESEVGRGTKFTLKLPLL